jgi:hypothetical protein
MDFVIGLDLGTAGSRAVAVGADGRIAAVASAAHPSLLTGDGQVEQDPADWWESAAGCLRQVTRQAGPAPLAVGLSGQMDGPVLLGGDGQVLGTCHIWADSRATAECGTMSSFLGLLTYFCVNAANIIFFLRYRRDRFNVVLNGIVPVIGIVVVLYILYKSYFASLWDAGWTYGRSVQLAVAIWLLLGIAWIMILRRRTPQLFTRRSQVFDADAAGGELAGTDA